jgi:DNA polymerase sigma
MTCEGPAEDVVSQVKGPWGSEADRQFVRLDISFEAPANTGLRTAELVRELMGQFPPITPLALLLKQFLADRSLDHPYKGGLSSYCQVNGIFHVLKNSNFWQEK